MITVSFTKFLEFVAQTGEPKATTALSAWRQSNTPYDPKRDYYKRLREEIISFEKNSTPVDWVAFSEAQNQKKVSNFKAASSQYDKWRSKFSSVEWFDPPKGEWKSSEFVIIINPELGLKLDGERHAIKLYFAKKKLSKLKAQMAGLLMQKTLSPSDTKTRFSIFDLHEKSLHTFNGPTEKLDLLLTGETAHISAMLEAIRNP